MDSLIIFGAKYLFVAVALAFLYLALRIKPSRRPEMAIAIVAAGVIAGALDKLFGKLYYDPRPFVSHHVTPLVAHAADNGFPSEHTLLAAAIASVILFYNKRLGYASFAIALLVGISRIAAHVHSPIDVIGSLIFGAIAGWGGYQFALKLSNRTKHH